MNRTKYFFILIFLILKTMVSAITIEDAAKIDGDAFNVDRDSCVKLLNSAMSNVKYIDSSLDSIKLAIYNPSHNLSSELFVKGKRLPLLDTIKAIYSFVNHINGQNRLDVVDGMLIIEQANTVFESAEILKIIESNKKVYEFCINELNRCVVCWNMLFDSEDKFIKKMLQKFEYRKCTTQFKSK